MNVPTIEDFVNMCNDEDETSGEEDIHVVEDYETHKLFVIKQKGAALYFVDELKPEDR